MARSRNIKPGFFTNEDLAELGFATRLLFAGLWTQADKSGRLEDRPKRLKMQLFPADTVDVDAMLQELHEAKMVVRYAINGVKYVCIPSWSKHQNPHHTEKASIIPDEDGVLTGKDQESSKSVQVTDVLIPDSLTLIPDALPSVPNGTAAEAAELTKAELWSAGKSLLAEQGMPKAQCGSFVGKLCKDYGDEVVIDAVRATCVARPADAAEYLKALCMRSAGQRTSKSASKHAGFDKLNYREGVSHDGSLA